MNAGYFYIKSLDTGNCSRFKKDMLYYSGHKFTIEISEINALSMHFYLKHFV